MLTKKYGLPLVQSTITSAFLYAMATNDSSQVGSDGQVAVTGRQQAAEDARSKFSDTMQQIFDDLIQETKQIKTRLFVPSGTRVTVFANADLWLRSSLEDEDRAAEERHGSPDTLLSEDQADTDPTQDLGANPRGSNDTLFNGNSSSGGYAPGGMNNPQNLQQQQQIYYNNYTGQVPQQQQYTQYPQQQQPPQKRTLIADRPQQPRQQMSPAAASAAQDKKNEPVDPVPELF